MDKYFDIAVGELDFGYGTIFRPHRLFEMAQVAHLALTGLTANAENCVWVNASTRSHTHLFETKPRALRYRSWVSRFSGNRSTREVTAHDADTEQILFERTMSSVALDAETLKPTKKDLSHLSDMVAGPPLNLPKIAMSADNANHTKFQIERQVYPDDIDQHRHVNNAVYVRWAFDALLSNKWETTGKLVCPTHVADIKVLYVRPSTLGMRISIDVSIAQNGDLSNQKAKFRISDPETKNLLATLEFTLRW